MTKSDVESLPSSEERTCFCGFFMTGLNNIQKTAGQMDHHLVNQHLSVREGRFITCFKPRRVRHRLGFKFCYCELLNWQVTSKVYDSEAAASWRRQVWQCSCRKLERQQRQFGDYFFSGLWVLALRNSFGLDLASQRVSSMQTASLTIKQLRKLSAAEPIWPWDSLPQNERMTKSTKIQTHQQQEYHH